MTLPQGVIEVYGKFYHADGCQPLEPVEDARVLLQIVEHLVQERNEMRGMLRETLVWLRKARGFNERKF